jgi:hypothetical protein
MKKNKSPAYYLNVKTDIYVHDNNDGDDSGEPYSYRGTTDTTRNFVSLKTSKTYGDVTVSFEPVLGRDYWLLYTEYSTGNSFGHDENAAVIYHDVYETVEVAYNALKELQEETNSITLNNGKKMKIYRAWEGYFEHLNGHDVVRLTCVPG